MEQKINTRFIELGKRKHQTFIFILTLILILGVFFRFVNIDKKAYWDDEAFTSLRVSGYTEYELVEKVSSTNLISRGELDKYQRINSEKNLIDTVKSLAIEDPQHPPLYYIITRFWAQLFGNSITTFRSISALISLLAFPSMYWLCWELFGSALTAQIAVAFIAISPFHVLYAQEAREYSLWTVMILLSSASLLYAMRLNRIVNWMIYTITVVISLYTFPSSIMVTVAQGIYLAIIEKFRWSRQLIAYLLGLITAFITFLPWLLVIITGLKHINRTVGGQGEMNTLSLMKTWAFNLSRIFIDSNNERMVINFGWENSFTSLIQIFLVGCIVLLTGYSLYFLCCYSLPKSWLLIILLISLTAFPIMLKDLTDGGVRSIILRYLTPAYLGIQISLAYFLAQSMLSKSYLQKLGKILTCLILSGSIISCGVSSQASSWWTKSHSDINFAAGKLINQSHRPLVISDGSMGMLLGLSHQLDSHVMFNLKPYCHTCIVPPNAVLQKSLFPIPNGFDVFLFATSPKLISQLKASSVYRISSVGVELWRLTQPSHL